MCYSFSFLCSIASNIRWVSYNVNTSIWSINSPLQLCRENIGFACRFFANGVTFQLCNVHKRKNVQACKKIQIQLYIQCKRMLEMNPRKVSTRIFHRREEEISVRYTYTLPWTNSIFFLFLFEKLLYTHKSKHLRVQRKKSQDCVFLFTTFSIDVSSCICDMHFKKKFSRKMHKLVIPFECVIYIR